MRRRETVGTWPHALRLCCPLRSAPPAYGGDARWAPPDRVPCPHTPCARGRDTRRALPAPARVPPPTTRLYPPRWARPGVLRQTPTPRRWGRGGRRRCAAPADASRRRGDRHETVPRRDRPAWAAIPGHTTSGRGVRDRAVPARATPAPRAMRSARPWRRACGTGDDRTAQTSQGVRACGGAAHPTPACRATAYGGDTRPRTRRWDDDPNPDTGGGGTP